jgi:hypothetical protein
MIDLSVVKQAYRKHEVNHLDFLLNEYNTSEVLTKVKRCRILEHILVLVGWTTPFSNGLIGMM